MSSIFIDPSDLPDGLYGFIQVLFLLVCYGLILMYGSSLISDGSELLLLIPSMAGIIGSIVLPVLGAVPDGCIVLFSGFGSDAQTQLDVGVGTLAGSTIMLLTIPWFLSVLGGRVNMEDGIPNYKGNPKLTKTSGWKSLISSGVVLGPYVNNGAYIMIGTSVTYLFLQIPGLIYAKRSVTSVAYEEKYWALAGFFVSLTLFIVYLIYQYNVSKRDTSAQQELKDGIVAKAIHKGSVSLFVALASEFADEELFQPQSPTETTALTNEGKIKRLRTILHPFFSKFDTDNSHTLDLNEISALLSDLGERPSREATELFKRFDKDQNGVIDFNEFISGVFEMISHYKNMDHTGKIRRLSSAETATHDIEGGVTGTTSTTTRLGNNKGGVDDNDDNDGRKALRASAQTDDDTISSEEDEDEEVPADLINLTPEQQQTAIKYRAAWMMGIGSLLILVFSDPMVEVLSNIGDRVGIRSFYIAFVLAPFASNGSELVAAYNYAIKKTSKSISISLVTLEGAASMNNTFGLAIFTILIFSKGLAWEYLAETLTILLAQIIIGLFAMRPSMTLGEAILVLSIYPLSIMFVAALEEAGWD